MQPLGAVPTGEMLGKSPNIPTSSVCCFGRTKFSVKLNFGTGGRALMVHAGHHNSCRTFLFYDFPDKVQKRQPGLMYMFLMHFNTWSRGAGGDGRNSVKEPGETWSCMLLHPMAITAKCCPCPWLTFAHDGRTDGVLFFTAPGASHHFSHIQSLSCSGVETFGGLEGKEGLFMLFIHRSSQPEQSISNIPARACPEP